MESERTLRENEDRYTERHLKEMWEGRRNENGEYLNAGTAAGQRWENDEDEND